jgi:hypothetical protein
MADVRIRSPRALVRRVVSWYCVDDTFHHSLLQTIACLCQMDAFTIGCTQMQSLAHGRRAHPFAACACTPVAFRVRRVGPFSGPSGRTGPKGRTKGADGAQEGLRRHRGSAQRAEGTQWGPGGVPEEQKGAQGRAQGAEGTQGAQGDGQRIRRCTGEDARSRRSPGG